MNEGIGPQVRKVYDKAKANKAAGVHREVDDVIISMMEVIVEQRKEICKYYRDTDIMLTKFKRVLENMALIEANVIKLLESQHKGEST